MKYIIIGSGVAGISAATAIRKNDPEGEITIITEEAVPHYSRIRLIEFPSGDVEEPELILKQDSWYEENRIENVLGDEATDIDTASKEVTTASGKKYGYDKLLLATGGFSFVPPIPGSDKKGVFTLRSLKDAVAIREHIKSGNNDVVMIGGGILGLEVANYLVKGGCSITVIEFFERLLPRQLDPDCSMLLQKQMKERKFKLYLGAVTQEIVGDDQAEEVVLKDGTRIKCNTIIISAGVRPRAELAKKLGLKMDKGVQVNDKMETELDDIYAAGDLIEHKGTYYGIWPASEKQGEVAGTNMAGGSKEYKGTTISNRLKVMGIDLVAAGDIDADGKHEAIVYKNFDGYICKKLVLEENKIIGTILYGDIKDWQRVLEAIDSKKDISSLRAELDNWKLEKL
jgi:nitrite reductase (NADH) large subunit